MANNTNLMEASNQWATRPADERFWSLEDLHAHQTRRNQQSKERELPFAALRTEAKGNGLVLTTPRGSAEMTNWSFSQLCGRANAPASYLRTLPSHLAAQNINHGLKALAETDATAQFLLHQEGTIGGTGKVTVRSLMTDYTRLWNSAIVEGLMKSTRNHGWMVPPARPSSQKDERARPATERDIVPGQENFGLAVKVGDMIAPAGVYEGDRDMFLFLVCPTRIIDDGCKGLMRGVFVWNSEVGAGAVHVKTFLLENVCGNHIVWGASKIKTFRAVHRGGQVLTNFSNNLNRALAAQTVASLGAEETMVRKARALVLGKDREATIETVFNNKKIGLTKTAAESAWEWATRWEHTALSAPSTAWGFVHGLTRFSQTMKNADERDRLDAAAGRILDIATAA